MEKTLSLKSEFLCFQVSCVRFSRAARRQPAVRAAQDRGPPGFCFLISEMRDVAQGVSSLTGSSSTALTEHRGSRHSASRERAVLWGVGARSAGPGACGGGSGAERGHRGHGRAVPAWSSPWHGGSGKSDLLWAEPAGPGEEGSKGSDTVLLGTRKRRCSPAGAEARTAQFCIREAWEGQTKTDRTWTRKHPFL